MGDLNYRIDMDPKNVQKCLEKNDLESLLENDQLIKEQLKGLDIDNFFEGKIEFFPTYKYEIGTDNYDFQDRVPSWTDRIIYKSKLNYDLIQLDYKTISQVRSSDHKPVYSVFKLLLNEKKNENNSNIENNFYNKIPLNNNDESFYNETSNNTSSVCVIF